MRILFLKSHETWPLRSQVLKPFLQPHECANPGDDETTTFHLGVEIDGRLTGVATFLAEPHPQFPESKNPYRLRGMATDPAFRRTGVGRELLEFGQHELRMRHCELLWFNAREVAFDFYKALGFLAHGDFFELPRIGPHKVMYKVLGRR